MSSIFWQIFQGFKINYVALDKRSWLEVRDTQHRYGKNLRLYFKVSCLLLRWAGPCWAVDPSSEKAGDFFALLPLFYVEKSTLRTDGDLGHIDHTDHVDHVDNLFVVTVCCTGSVQYRSNPGNA